MLHIANTFIAHIACKFHITCYIKSSYHRTKRAIINTKPIAPKRYGVSDFLDVLIALDWRCVVATQRVACVELSKVSFLLNLLHGLTTALTAESLPEPMKAPLRPSLCCDSDTAPFCCAASMIFFGSMTFCAQPHTFTQTHSQGHAVHSIAPLAFAVIDCFS